MFYQELTILKLFYLLDNKQEKEAFSLRNKIDIVLFQNEYFAKLQVFDKYMWQARAFKTSPCTNYKIDNVELLTDKFRGIYLAQRSKLELIAGNLYDSFYHLTNAKKIFEIYKCNERLAEYLYHEGLIGYALGVKESDQYFDKVLRITKKLPFIKKIKTEKCIWELISSGGTSIDELVKAEFRIILWNCISLHDQKRTKEIQYYLMWCLSQKERRLDKKNIFAMLL